MSSNLKASAEATHGHAHLTGDEVQRALERELTDSLRLQEISTRLIGEGDFDALLDEILYAAIAIMHGDKGTMQLAARERPDELRLLTSQGFQPEFVEAFELLGLDDNTACIAALKQGRRVVVTNIETSEIFSGTPSAEMHRKAGVEATQSPPLISRSVRLLGMISTHGASSHQPGERELRLLDLLARQAADLIERHQSESALRERERELSELSQSLEQRIGQRTAELQEQTNRLRNLAADLASAEQRERKRLAALLHDDLQQLLVAAGMQLREVSRRVKDEDGARAIRNASQWIGEAANVARDLTGQLRPPTLYEDGLVPALHWLASKMRERYGLRVIIDGGEAARTLSDDIKAMLFECVREILFNTVKHAGVECATVSVNEAPDCVVIIVVDQGCGFDLDTIAGHHRASEGIGLFSIRERLAALGGVLIIESTVGAGTRIDLKLPLGFTEGDNVAASGLLGVIRANAPPDARDAAATGRRTRVLVVDDHAIVREGIANVLSAEKRLVVVAQAADGVEAMEAAEQHRPDVVLVDLNMPRMNGVETTREIRRRWPETRIIGLSVQDDEATAKSMLDAGAQAFVSKSGDSDRIIAAVLDRRSIG